MRKTQVIGGKPGTSGHKTQVFGGIPGTSRHKQKYLRVYWLLVD